VTNLQLVKCMSSVCLLLVNDSVFVSLLLEESGNCRHVASLDAPEDSQKQNCLPSYQIVSNNLVLLEEKTDSLCILLKIQTLSTMNILPRKNILPGSSFLSQLIENSLPYSYNCHLDCESSCGGN